MNNIYFLTVCIKEIFPANTFFKRRCAMIKGVNRRVIEVRCLENDNFEKALFFVNERKPEIETQKLVKMAKVYCKSFFNDKKSKAKSKNKFKIYKSLCIIGAIFAFIFIFIQNMFS